MKVICFGDSNTYDYDPRSVFGWRYAADSRRAYILRSRSTRLLPSDYWRN